MSTSSLIQTKGIYHGLPVYPESLQGLTAIVTGANGISGYHMVRVLAESPQRWRKIFCLSRRPPLMPSGLPGNIEFVPCDFLMEPSKIAKSLREKGVQADYVFFYSYIQPPPKLGEGVWSDVEELTRLNTTLLGNFLTALDEMRVVPRRFMLQTGAKNYGLHMGPVKVPCEEWDPRLNLEPNFYYAQEDLLWSHCKQQSIGWNVVMPAAILGAVPDAAMNLCLPLAIYATVCKHLNRPLLFPGDRLAWQSTTMQSSAMLNGYFEEWVVLKEQTRDQKFNIVDSSGYSPEKFWPRLAGWYGIDWEAPVVYGNEVGQVTQVTYGHDPPPRGYGPPGTIRFLFLWSSWAKRPEVQNAWKEIVDIYNLSMRGFSDPDRLFGFADSIVLSGDVYPLSMDKSRKLGWHGFVDTTESMLEVLRELAKLKMIPPVPEVTVKFL